MISLHQSFEPNTSFYIIDEFFNKKTLKCKMSYRVNTFLGCFKLESGGIAIGWTNLVMGTITLIYSSFVIVNLTAKSVDYQCSGIPKPDRAWIEGVITFCACMMAIAVFSMYAGFTLMRSVENRKSRIISPAIVVLLATVYLLWSVIIGQQYLLVIFLVPLFYALIALKSLSKMFEDEADAKTRNRPNPIQTVQNVQQIKEMYQLI